MVRAMDLADARPDMALGLGTGNIRKGAEIKLGCVGIFHRFSFGGFGDDSIDRPTLLMAGARRGADKLGLPIEDCRIVVIGDTPRDVSAAKAIGAESIAVATGMHDSPSSSSASQPRVREPGRSPRRRGPPIREIVLLSPGCIEEDSLSIYDGRVGLERTRRWAFQDLAGQVEDGGVAGALDLHGVGIVV
jgi:hypothetical protein